jgi:hypothetical protein
MGAVILQENDTLSVLRVAKPDPGNNTHDIT